MNLPWSSIAIPPPEKVHAIVECSDQSVHTKGEFLKLAENIPILETRGTASVNAALIERKLAMEAEKRRGQCHSFRTLFTARSLAEGRKPPGTAIADVPDGSRRAATLIIAGWLAPFRFATPPECSG
jgi:hypothetical protein